MEARLRSKGLKVVRDHVPPERLQTTDLSGEAVLNALRLLSPWHAGHEMIRLGEDRDGGYLVPDDLDGIRACFSPGVDLASHFERDCIRPLSSCPICFTSVFGRSWPKRTSVSISTRTMPSSSGAIQNSTQTFRAWWKSHTCAKTACAERSVR